MQQDGGAALMIAKVHNSVQLHNPHIIQTILSTLVTKDVQLHSHKRPEYLNLNVTRH